MKIRIFTTRLAILAEEDRKLIYRSSFKCLGTAIPGHFAMVLSPTTGWLPQQNHPIFGEQ